MPQFVLGFLLLYLFAYKIPIFPLGATASLPALVLPALALGVPGAAWYARMVRSSVAERARRGLRPQLPGEGPVGVGGGRAGT